MIISLRYSAAFVCRSTYPSSSPSWCTSAAVDLDQPIWPTPFSRSPGFYTTVCSWRLSVCLPRHEHGTICQLK